MLELLYTTGYAFLTATAVFFAWKLMIAYQKFNLHITAGVDSIEGELPSVSVCIPARNEVHAMTQCLERVIASDYPKIEIIVLDDSSVDDTSILIKSFAHAGVRFVEGSALPEGWLGKNHALEGLLHEASGSYILYMDVDTHIAPTTISQLVAYARQEKSAMVSILPRRNDGLRLSVVWATLRYFWELVFHMRSAPAVASSAWLVHRHTLRDEIGGFSPFRLEVQPESRLASFLSKSGRYRFLIGSENLGISYEKKWLSQVETSVRLLLPRAGGSILGGIIGVGLLAALNLPTIFLIVGLFSEWSIIQTVALWFVAIFSLIYASYAFRVWNRGWWLGALLWPYLVFQEMILMILSVSRYATGRVTWKGRPILRPAVARRLERASVTADNADK